MFLGGNISYKCIRMRLKVVVYVGQKPKTVVEITPAASAASRIHLQRM